ncbi:MAG: type III pantothenate kinase [Thermoguttaceae bacterium]|nr:type III pantothenate kinase [Thermoguttaceae bacterium]MBQ9456225.1 type III pantothenate kinase [Thermoguttaceae bacterium]
MISIALDIGNTRCKLSDEKSVFRVPHQDSDFTASFPEILQTLHADGKPCEWWIASVNRNIFRKVTEWLAQNRPGDRVNVLNALNVPIQVDVEFPEKVGVDLLLSAITANEIRDPGRPAIIVDLGTVAKVDLVDENGVFRGGAFAPGLRMGAVAMDQQTDALPEIDVMEMLHRMETHGIPSVAQNTIAAMQAGLFWGMVGTIRELTARTASTLAIPPQIFLTGGGAKTVRDALGEGFTYVDEMVMKGIWTTIRKLKYEP